jgi:multidrug efflux pump
VSPSRPFILRPIATSLLMAGLLLAGLVGFRQLPVSALPEVDYPTIQVVTFYPGASPDVMASAVTAPLERQFGQVPGLNQMTSTSSEGSSLITLQFVLDLNIDVAEQQVQAAINAAGTYLPRDLPNPPIYSKTNPADAPVLTLALTSKTLPLAKVEDLADTRLAQKISQLPGVGLVSISGGQKPAVRIQANPTALSSYGLTLEDVRTVVAQANVNQAKGSFDGSRQSYSIATNDQLLSSEQYRPLVIAYKNGAPVHLSDVATVVDAAENVRQAAWMNQVPAVILNIQRQPGANIIGVVDRIQQLLPQLRSSLPSAVQVAVLTDRTATIRASVHDVEFELMLTIALVVMVIFLFLRTFAATVIPSVAVPLSLVGTFGAMYLLGYSLNNLTLMALTISTGFVVDDAIVMIENIMRYIEEGMEPRKAALEGAEQIGFTILSLTVSLIAVLIPLLFMGDVVGRLFREFAVTLSVTILVSAFVSLTLTPMMCARLLHHRPESEEGRFYRASERVFRAIIDFYGRTLTWVLARQRATLAVAVATLVATLLLYVFIAKGFFPVQDTGVILGVSEAAQDVSFTAMAERQQALARVILADPAVASLSSFIGIDGTNTTLNTGRIQINLKPLAERGIGASDLIRRLLPALAKVSGITLFMQPVQDLTVEDRVSRAQFQYSLEDADAGELAAWVPRFVARLATLPELRDVASDQQNAGRQARLVLDRVPARHHAADARRRALRRLRPAPDLDPVHAVEPVPRRAGEQAGLPAAPGGAGERLPALVYGRRGAARRLHPRRGGDRAAVGQPPGAVPGGHRLLQPGARRLARRGGARGRAGREGRRPAAERPGRLPRHGAVVPGLARQRAAADPRRRGDGLHPARRALRELHPPPDDPLDAALGRRRRPAGAARLPHRVQRHRAHRHHPAHRHRGEERDHDDRLRARRRAQGGQGAAGRDLPGRPAALPADHHDHDGGDAGRRAARARPGDRGGAAAPARHRDHRRPDLQPAADALHDAGRLSRLRPPGAAADPQAGGAGAPPRARESGADVNVSAPFINRPIATTLLTVAVALAGGIAFRFLPVSPLPQVEFPTIQVQSGLPGASPETMSSSVATPLERQFGRIAGITEMTSTSSLGSTSITLQFDLNRNIDAAARDVQAAINAARGQLPANLPNNPSYRKVNPSEAPVMLLALTSDLIEKPRMYDVASSILQQKLAQIEGVGQVTIGGGALPAVRVDLNPTVLAGYGIGLEDVRTALANANANRPKGEIAGAGRSWTLATTDQLHKAAEYRSLLISYRNGAGVRLGDVADVADSVEDIRTGGLANGKPAILVIISRQPGANIIATVDRIRALLPQLRASIPPAITLSVVQDSTRTIRASVHDVEITLAISIALVILVVFVFLRDVRSTFIPSVAVPVSLIGTFGVMYLLGYSIDNLSLMALTVATGFVVDDAIVVIENITRYLEQGTPPLAAALTGAKEIGFTVMSISLSLVAVFIPILLMGGIVGRLFREFAVTLSIAIGVSLLVSLTTTPMMCAQLLRSREREKHGRLYRRSERGFEWVLGRYEASLSWVLRHQPLTMLITLLTMGASLYLYVIIPKGFFPQQDTGRLSGSIQADQSSSFKAMQQRLAGFVAVVQHDPAVETVTAFTGGSNSGRMFVALREDRKVTADQVIARLRPRLAHVPGANLFLQPVQDLRVGGRMGAAQYQYTLQGDDPQELLQWAPRVLQRLRALPQLADVNSDQQNKGLAASLVIDRATAARLGITPQLIDATLYDAFGQRPVSTMYEQLNQYHVVMQVAPQFWQNPEGLKYVEVRAADGRLVPLAAFTHFESANAPLTINHQGQFPAVTLSFNLPPGVALGDAVTAIDRAEQGLGLPADMHGSFQGTAQAFQASLANEPILILAALLTVYIVLGMLYESTIHPITILSTLPSAGVGALLALLLCHAELSVIALIGIILLIGIVKKNAILMIDFAIEVERREGKKPADAIFQACLLRFRPITMTTMAAMLGGLPLAIGIGTGSELRRPLGIAIVGGLLFSQLLTLYTTPVVYLYLDRFQLAWRRWRQRHGRAVPAGAEA